MCLRRAPEKYITGAALDRAVVDSLAVIAYIVVKPGMKSMPLGNIFSFNHIS
jgi:hypothetical protein